MAFSTELMLSGQGPSNTIWFCATASAAVMSDGSDYGNFDADFALSWEDFASIDAIASAAYASTPPTSGPSIAIELEPSADASPALPFMAEVHQEDARDRSAHEKQERKLRSPYKQFRSWRKGFTVTDLVGPAW